MENEKLEKLKKLLVRINQGIDDVNNTMLNNINEDLSVYDDCSEEEIIDIVANELDNLVADVGALTTNLEILEKIIEEG